MADEKKEPPKAPQPQNSAPQQPKMPENRLVTGTRHFPNRIDLNRTKK